MRWDFCDTWWKLECMTLGQWDYRNGVSRDAARVLYCPEVWKFCKIILREKIENMKKKYRTKAKLILLKIIFKNVNEIWLTFGVIAAQMATYSEMLVNNNNNSGVHHEGEKVKIFRIWIQHFMDFIRSMYDFKKRKTSSMKIGIGIQCVNRLGFCPQH